MPLKRTAPADAPRAQAAARDGAAPRAVGSAALEIDPPRPAEGDATASGTRDAPPARVVSFRPSPGKGTPLAPRPPQPEARVEQQSGEVLAMLRRRDETPYPPPVLASEALREDLEPREHGRDPMRRAAIAAGLIGIAIGAAALSFAGFGFLTAVCVAAFAAAAAAGAAPLTYTRRAWVVTGAGVAAAVTGVGMRLTQGASAREAWIAAAVLILAAGLFFRGAHRASKDARAIVAVGLLLATGWLGESLTHDTASALAAGAPAWAYWSVMGLRVGLGVVLLLSLLAFMHAGTTGGCTFWGLLAAVWIAAYEVVQVAAAREREGWAEVFEPAAAAAAVAIGVGLAALGLAQALESRACSARASSAPA